MKKIIKILFLAVSIFCFSVVCVHGWSGRVVQVLDGDSLRVKRGKKVVEVRLYGIDCPEWGQAYGNRAKRFARKVLYKKEVSVLAKDVDRYGRVVALVSHSGLTINRELVRAGLAWVYPKYCTEQPLCSEWNRLELKARTERQGLWRAADPVSPWQWKRLNRGR